MQAKKHSGSRAWFVEELSRICETVATSVILTIKFVVADVKVPGSCMLPEVAGI